MQKIHVMYQNNEKTSLENKEVETVEPVHMNIYQSNTYREDLRWLHFNNMPRGSKEATSEGPTVLHTVTVFVAFLTVPSSS